ncbi:cytochrome P450 [Coniophora puteana RWD-64-598 SS2]|uniref:Cytochrome P450 n=1 Tax=Coniophora puteana (strain RWD-64-598) TaxID=741705 RepID=A0A5M3N0J1_CONPW|nr:cytochrome P450 [Coniophora puteana RWD-64-598 SS2]EIW84425.1 cytochrome P450 [Coniophora puteana RWD-64-598 SS2]
MALSLPIILLFVTSLWALAGYATAKSRRKRTLPFPPGPYGLPFLGAALQVNADNPWLTYVQWAAKYGDIVSCLLLGTQVIVLNSEEVADDLLERRSRIYSDRPEMSTTTLSGWDFNFGFDRYDDKWRLNRRLFQQSFREKKVQDYWSTQRAAAHRLLLNIGSNPAEKLWDLFQLCTSSTILSTVYGYDATTLDDPLFHIGSKTIATGIPLVKAEKTIIVDTFPFVKYLPAWAPGTSIFRGAEIAKPWAQQFVDVPYNFTMEKMRSNPDFPCVLSETIRSGEESGQSIPVINLKQFAATAFIGGAESSSSVLQTLVLAMLKNPAVQRRAQADIQSVIGDDRLPTFEDRPSLPYIDAVLREVMRWNPHQENDSCLIGKLCAA